MTIEIGCHKVTREAALIAGEAIGWEGAFASDFFDDSEYNLLSELRKVRKSLDGDELKYIPPRLAANGVVQGVVRWSETKVGRKEPERSNQDGPIETPEGKIDNRAQALEETAEVASEAAARITGEYNADESEAGSKVDCLADGEDSYADVEVEGDTGDSAVAIEASQTEETPSESSVAQEDSSADMIQN